MRCKCQGDVLTRAIPQLLLDLRRMPMRSDTVSLDGFIHFRVQILQLGAASRAGNAGLGIDDDRIILNDPLRDQRRQAQNTAGRIAAGIGQKPCGADLLPIPLAQPVYRFFGQKLLPMMLCLIPLFIDCRILEPEIRTQINDLALRQDLLCHLG